MSQQLPSEREVITIGSVPIGNELFVTYVRRSPGELFIPRPSETAKPHVYQRLSQGHARILRRVPQSNKNELIFEFVSIPISDIQDQRQGKEPKEEYKAISYCWGISPIDQALVLADGSTVPITKKVAHIIQVILHRVLCDAIWIDAICINQQDPVEKSGQIALMPGIYHHATSVEIWLDAGWSSMQVICEALDSRNMSPKVSFRAGMLRPDDSYSALTPYTNEEITDMMWSPWFERAWVVQEFCYSKEANFHFRGVMATMLFLEKVYIWGADLGFGRIEGGNGSRIEVPIPPMIRHFGALISMRREILQREFRQNPLEDVLCRFYHCRATDPRDKVIAFLGLANGEWLKKVTVDYGRSPVALYLDIVIAMMQKSTDYALLGFAGIASRRPLFKDSPDVPSWLPDLSTPPHHTTWSCQWQRFNASGIDENKGARVHSLNLEELVENQQAKLPSTAIGTHGTCIGTVVGGIKGHERQNFAYLSSFITAALEISHKLSPYPTGESARDVLWKTLIAVNPLGFERDESGAGFDQLCEWAKTGNLNLDKIWALDGRYYQTMLVEGAGGARGLFWTESGYMGLAANEVKIGDKVWIFMGARVPFILRSKACLTGGGSHDPSNVVLYNLVTEAYVHGVMRGESGAQFEKRIILV